MLNTEAKTNNDRRRAAWLAIFDELGPDTLAPALTTAQYALATAQEAIMPTPDPQTVHFTIYRLALAVNE